MKPRASPSGSNDDLERVTVSPSDSGDNPYLVYCTRAKSDEFLAAKRAEIHGLTSRNVWQTVPCSEVPKGANVIGGRFDLTIKNVGTDREKPKARFVGQGFRDNMKDFIVHNVPTLRQSSTRFILSCAAVMGYRLAMVDFVQAYLQAKEKLGRDIYIRVKNEDRELFGVGQDELLKLEKPLYGICDSGDYWGATLDSFIQKELGMNSMTGDPSVYILNGPLSTIGLLGAYIDDNLFAGSPDFDPIIARTALQFESKPVERNNVEFVGLSISTEVHEDGHRSFYSNQPQYVAKLRVMPPSSSLDLFGSVHSSVAWISHSRPDICCAVNRASQVTEDTFSEKSIKELNDAIVHGQGSKDLRLSYAPLDRSSLHIRAYADASFATNMDLTSQLGFIIFLSDDTGRCHVLNYCSRKSRTPSVNAPYDVHGL